MSEFDTNLDASTVETQKETDKKCPDCFGVMDFDPKTGGLACPYCNTSYRDAASAFAVNSFTFKTFTFRVR